MSVGASFPGFADIATVLIAGFVLTPSLARAQSVTEPALKAAFIYNFAKFTGWPAGGLPPAEPFVMCVPGDAAVADALSRVVNASLLAGHDMTVSQVTPAGPNRECHVLGEVRAKGLELEAQMRLKGESRALMSYALQSAVDQETRANLPNSPRHMVQGRMNLPGPTAESSVSVEGQYLSSRNTLAGLKVSAAAIANLTMVQPHGRSVELFGGVRNVFNAQYADPASSQHRQDAIPQNGRTARIGLRWMLRTK